jgi:hypothetical protein
LRPLGQACPQHFAEPRLRILYRPAPHHRRHCLVTGLVR